MLHDSKRKIDAETAWESAHEALIRAQGNDRVRSEELKYCSDQIRRITEEQIEARQRLQTAVRVYIAARDEVLLAYTAEET